MLKYFIVLLDDTSVSFCHYSINKKEHNLISIDNLKAGIVWAMKENLMIQYVLPEYNLPEEYMDLLDSIDNSKIVPYNSIVKGDVIVLNGWDIKYIFDDTYVYVLRLTKNELFDKYIEIKDVLKKVARLNIVITDVETFDDQDTLLIKQCLIVSLLK